MFTAEYLNYETDRDFMMKVELSGKTASVKKNSAVISFCKICFMGFTGDFYSMLFSNLEFPSLFGNYN